MYKGFNVKITREFFEDKYEKYHSIGKKVKLTNKITAHEILKKYIHDDILDGTEIEDEWFKKMNSDIFISYSHNDSDLVTAFAGWLKSEFNLNVFFDEIIWKEADDLLYEIDKKYCINEDKKTFSYEKRNLSTSHVHSMLTVSILKTIDLAESVMFINTKESIPIAKDYIEDGKNYTMSPWLYQELTIVNNIQVRDLKYYRKNLILESSKEIKSYQKLEIKYEVDLKKLNELNEINLVKWKNDYAMNKYLDKEANALDVLYKLIGNIEAQ